MNAPVLLYLRDFETMDSPRAEQGLTTKAQQLDAFLRQVERRALRMAELGTQNRDDALDIVQDTMLVFVRNYQDKPAADWLVKTNPVTCSDCPTGGASTVRAAWLHSRHGP